MYKHVCDKLELELDEVECFEICIRKIDGGYEEADMRGCWHEIELGGSETIESFISNYVQ
jgi:hypothetical protein